MARFSSGLVASELIQMTAVAEKSFRDLRSTAASQVQFIVVSHSNTAATQKWLSSVGGAGHVRALADSERKLYAQWGLGVSSFWHVLNPWSLLECVQHRQARGYLEQAQTAGSFGADYQGIVRWSRKAVTANEVVDIQQAVQAVVS